MERNKKACVENQELQDQQTVGSRHLRELQYAVEAGPGFSKGSGHLAVHSLMTHNLYLQEGAEVHRGPQGFSPMAAVTPNLSQERPHTTSLQDSVATMTETSGITCTSFTRHPTCLPLQPAGPPHACLSRCPPAQIPRWSGPCQPSAER